MKGAFALFTPLEIFCVRSNELTNGKIMATNLEKVQQSAFRCGAKNLQNKRSTFHEKCLVLNMRNRMLYNVLTIF